MLVRQVADPKLAGGGAKDFIALASGDFVFVGDVGRPDLLERAAGMVGVMEPSARAQFASIQREFRGLPAFLQVWPAHGAGSACGKSLGDVPTSTVGYELRTNRSIHAAVDEQTFVDFILAGQPEPPLYFARMKRDNRRGPALLPALPAPARLDVSDLPALENRRDIACFRGFIGTACCAAARSGIPVRMCSRQPSSLAC